MFKLKEYRVAIMERWAQYYTVKAKSPEQAIQLVQEGEGDMKEGPMGFEYRDTMDTETWEVEEIEGE